jgi:hypothetical protein
MDSFSDLFRALETPCDEGLTEDDKLVLGELSTLCRRVDSTGSKSDLERAADCAIDHMDRRWPVDRWTEVCLVIACRCSTDIWVAHRDAPAAYQRLQPLAEMILSLGWMTGGPTGHLVPSNTETFLMAITQCETVLATRSDKRTQLTARS